MTASIVARWRLPIILLVLAVLVLALWWQVRNLDGNARGGPTSTGLTLYPVAERVAVPAVDGTALDGSPLKFDDLRGHVAVLNVWGSWCAPCRAEAPDLAKISRETQSKGVRFVGIDVRDNPAAARAFAERFDIAYPSFNDQHGLVLAQFAGLIPVSAVPSTLVIDQQGLVTARVVGRIDPTTLRGLIKDAGGST